MNSLKLLLPLPMLSNLGFGDELTEAAPAIANANNSALFSGKDRAYAEIEFGGLFYLTDVISSN